VRVCRQAVVASLDEVITAVKAIATPLPLDPDNKCVRAIHAAKGMPAYVGRREMTGDHMMWTTTN